MDFIEMWISSIKQEDQEANIEKHDMISPAGFGASNSGDLSGATTGNTGDRSNASQMYQPAMTLDDSSTAVFTLDNPCACLEMRHPSNWFLIRSPLKLPPGNFR